MQSARALSPARRGEWRLLAACPLIAALGIVAGLVLTHHAGVAFRDPDNGTARYLVEVGALVLLLVVLDIYVRAAARTGTARPSRAAMRAVRRERWTRHRSIAVGAALVSFYLTYLAYRNLKGAVPLIRRGDLFDRQLADADRALFFGHDPAVLLHHLLGTGVSTHILSTAYVAFIVFLPLSLGLALVFSERLQVTLFYAATLSINWLLGAASYFVLPSLGPAYANHDTFASLPHSEVTRLQQFLLDQRTGFLHDPAAGTPQSIAAFASLHIAMSFTALLAAYVLGLGRRVKIALWIWVSLTFVDTVYLGWHYVVDDLAGLLIGAAALVLASKLTGFDPRAAVRRTSASENQLALHEPDRQPPPDEREHDEERQVPNVL